MAIKQLIELIGDDIVISKLDAVQKKGEATLASFNKSTGELKLPSLDIPKIDAKPIQDFTGHTVKLKDALHTLQPILKTAGLQVGEMGAFARLASNNVVLLGIAVAGAVTVGLAKLGENAARAKGQLDDAFGGRGRGQQALVALNKQALEFGSTVEGLAPGLQSFEAALQNVDRTAKGFVAFRAEDLPGATLASNVDKVSEAYGNFIKLLRAGRQTQEEAEKTAKAFFDTVKDGGAVTSAALKALPAGTVNELKIALGGAGLTTKAFFQAVDAGLVTMDKFQNALLAIGPQAQKAFDTKAIKTMGDELGKLGVTLTQGLPNLTTTASTTVNFFLGAVRGLLQAVLLVTEDVIEKTNSALAKVKLASTKTFVGPTLEQAGLGEAAGFRAPFPTPEQAGKVGQDVGSAFNQGFLKAGFVFPPQAGATLASSLKDNPFFTTELPQAVAEPINQGLRAAVIAFSAGENLAPLVESFRQTGTQSAERFVEGFDPISEKITSLAQSWYQAVISAFSTPVPVTFQPQGGSFEGGGAPFARGGMVRGGGTATSDSILAFLSNREFVVNARATSFYGPDLFAALNAMRLPRDFISRFSMGGLARALGGNKFAAGGQVRSGNPVVLKIDRQSFNMTAGDDVIGSLKRFAVASQLSSTGRKPRWVK